MAKKIVSQSIPSAAIAEKTENTQYNKNKNQALAERYGYIEPMKQQKVQVEYV